MKKLILIPIVLFALSAISQNYCDSVFFKREIADAKNMKKDAFVKLGIGMFSHAIGTQELIAGPLTDVDVRGGFIMYNTIGLSFDVLAVVQLIKAKKKKKKFINLL